MTKLVIERKVVEQVLKALEHAHASEPIWKTPIIEATRALQQALEADQQANPIATVKYIDEYGPMLEWCTHWVNLAIGTKLYTQ